MNRRNFITGIGSSILIAPTIVAASIRTFPIKELEVFRWSGNYIKIIDVEELKSYGVRSATYSASCVDRNGMFAHEENFDYEHSEPFIRKSFTLKSVPKIWWEDTRLVNTAIANMDINKVVDEIKDHMEYVCMVGYGMSPCLCGRETCHKNWIPFVGGLDKNRYNRYVKELNEYRS